MQMLANKQNTAYMLQGGDVAFTIVVNRQEEDDADDKSQPEQDEVNRTEVDFMQEAVQEAITEAVQDAVQEVSYEPMCIEKQPDAPPHTAGFFTSWFHLACRQIAVSLTAFCAPLSQHASLIDYTLVLS